MPNTMNTLHSKPAAAPFQAYLVLDNQAETYLIKCLVIIIEVDKLKRIVRYVHVN